MYRAVNVRFIEYQMKVMCAQQCNYPSYQLAVHINTYTTQLHT